MKATALLFVLALSAPPALAQTCPADMSAIDAALPNVRQKSAAEMNEIKRLRTEGETLFKAGKLPECMASLGKAKELIGIGAKGISTKK